MEISDKIKNLKESPTLALVSKAKELRGQGVDVISLAIGEPNWDSFSYIKKAGCAAIDAGKTKYTPASGVPELRKAIALRTNKDLKTDYTFQNVTVSTGAKYVLFSALQSLLNPGDEALIPSPYWVSYPDIVRLAGGKDVIIPCDEKQNFKVQADSLQAHITNRTKVLLLNSPSNPTGACYTASELKALAEVLLKYPHVTVICDDIYQQLFFGEEPLSHLLLENKNLMDQVLVVNGVSKSYAMTGWRIGWGVGNQNLIQAMTRFQSQTVSSPCSISQEAALEALSKQDEVDEKCQVLKKKAEFFLNLFSDISSLRVNPIQSTFYAWVSIKPLIGKKIGKYVISDSNDFAKALLEEKALVVVPGTAFGVNDFVRMSFSLSENDLVRAKERIIEFLSLAG